MHSKVNSLKSYSKLKKLKASKSIYCSWIKLFSMLFSQCLWDTRPSSCHCNPIRLSSDQMTWQISLLLLVLGELQSKLKLKTPDPRSENENENENEIWNPRKLRCWGYHGCNADNSIVTSVYKVGRTFQG